ncbi:MAG: hypothetical protein IKY38_06130 [Anaerotignum sp.]|nr:hypothetical protein [Anaerotignum sp.]MBR6542526.1 hypothetical protein [Anaerotignum sp.]
MLDKLKKVRDALLTVTADVSHYFASKKTSQYIVWMETGEASSLMANNCKQVQAIKGTIDYFTKKDFDQNVDDIQNALQAAEISYFLESVQYEEETGYIHYEWKFEVV